MNENFSFRTDPEEAHWLELCRQGNKDAGAKLAAAYLETVQRIASNYHVLGIEQDDLVQEGLIGLLQAAKTYRPAKGCSFRTYACICVNNRMKKLVEHTSTGKYSALSRAINIDDFDFSADLNDTPEERLIEQEKLAKLNDSLDGLLSEFEKTVFLFHMQGYRQAQIAKALGTSPKSVYNALGRVRRKMKQMI